MADRTYPIPGTLDTTPSRAASPVEWLHRWVITVDHKRLGILYVVYALFFLLVAGAEAIAMRIQLAVPNNHFLSPELFNEFFTMHGTTMVFLVGMTIIFGIGNYLVPLMIGARDMAFPRLNAFSFWMSAFGGFFLYFSFVGGFGLYGMGSAPDVTWWAYAPLTAKAFTPGHNTDYWALSLIVMGFGTLGAAINILATAFSMRCRGMTLFRMPLFVWLMVVTSGLTLITITPLTAAQVMLIIDRYLGAHFFDAQAGGAPIVWMHFFWIFGHPEVYVLILPAFGIASEVIPVFSRKAIFGYPGHGRGLGRYRFRQHYRVGAPHVHRRHDVGGQHLLRAFYHDGRDSHRHQDLQLDCDHVGRQNSLRYADAVLHGFPVPVPLRGTHRNHAFERSVELAITQFLLRDRAFPLYAHRLLHLLHLCRFLLLVSEGYRAHAEREARQMALLAILYRLPSHVRYDAFRGHTRHAALYLYLRGGSRMEHTQLLDFDGWPDPGDCGAVLRLEPDRLLFTRQRGRQRSMGCLDFGVVDAITSAGLQLR